MSFWRNFGFYTISQIESILDRGDYTLEELLDEEEVLQEVKAQNKRLLEFLTQRPQLEKLFEYITKEPAEDAETKRKFKFPFIACEILASEVWTIVDAVYKNEDLVAQLFAFLEKDAPLNALMASFVSRVTAVLLEKKPSQMVELLKKKDNFISLFLKHLSSASVMELLLKVVAAEELCEEGGILQWLRDSHLIKSLVSKLDASLDSETHENASKALVEIIRASTTKSSPLMDELEGEDTLRHLLDTVFADNANSTLLNGLTVIIELLKRNAKPTFAPDTQENPLPPVFQVCVTNLDKFKVILHAKPAVAKMFTSMGEIEPVGFVRLKVLEFVLALVQSNYEAVDKALVETDILSSSFDLFFRYPWNNFLHSLVEKIVRQIFQGSNDNLKEAVIKRAKLAEKIAEADTANAVEVNKPKGVRRGYMGHLTQIAATIQDEATVSEPVAKALDEITSWKTYAEGTLRELRSIEGRPLGGARTGSSLDSGSPPTSDDDYDGSDPELDFSNDDDLVLKGDDTQRMDGSDDYDPEREFKQIEQNSHDSDDEEDNQAAEQKETEQPPSQDNLAE